MRQNCIFAFQDKKKLICFIFIKFEMLTIVKLRPLFSMDVIDG
jgi:hypothetical protein